MSPIFCLTNQTLSLIMRRISVRGIMKSCRSLFIFFSLTIFASLSFTPVAQADPRKLIFAVDGLSFEAFQVSQQKDPPLFQSFKTPGRHIAPYPSMTEPSWTEILGGKKLFQSQGNNKTIE